MKSIFEASYPKIELTKMEKDEKLRYSGPDDEMNTISEALHLNAIYLPTYVNRWKRRKFKMKVLCLGRYKKKSWKRLRS